VKSCRSCGCEKPESEFHRYPRNRDGLQSFCKACQAEKKRAKYIENAPAQRAESLQRYAFKKAQGLITDDQRAAKAAYDRAYRAKNEDRLAAIKNAWRATNADLVRAVRVAHKAKRRAQLKQGDPSRVVADWLAKQERVCRWCGVDCSSDFHIDHVIPLARGGQHVTENLCIACPTCNVRKHAKLPEEWQRHRCDVGMLS
jgi:5-methylcytosine-specific restriction endonuclease McrA